MNNIRKNQNRTNLLILSKSQFGSHIDTYMYCKYLSKKYNVTYLCWDYGKSKVKLNDVKTIYISRNGNIIARNIRYILSSIKYIRENRVELCFIKYFTGCSILKILFLRKNFIFDIRTGSVNSKIISRFIYNLIMRTEACFFKNVTVISQSLAQKLKLSKKANILPVGSSHISNSKKDFQSLKLIYVGTFNNRNLEKTIYGFYNFIKSNTTSINCKYTLIGDGDHGEKEYLFSLVKYLKLDDKVDIVGRVPFDMLKEYFDSHNIGVSFVPITSFFDVQPVTKTFDYLLSGIPVIATATTENKKVIKEGENGVLINDSIEDFKRGIEHMQCLRHNFSCNNIMKFAQKYHWESIVKNLENYIQNILINKDNRIFIN